MTRRQHSHFAHALLVIAAVAIAGASPTAVRAAGAVSIPELMAAKKKGEWPAYAQSGASMKIEGRQAVFSSTLLRFLKCEDLNFVWYKEDEPFPVDPANLHGRNLEVFGRFEMRSSKPTFVVRQLRTLPSDEEALRDERAR